MLGAKQEILVTKPTAAALSTLDQPFDETALAQLGAAMVLLWKQMPGQMRADLLDAAEAVAGMRSVRDVRNRLDTLIQRQTSRALLA